VEQGNKIAAHFGAHAQLQITEGLGHSPYWGRLH
jgi:hypothetical protein